MKIITPGKVYLFACKCCGCEFAEGAKVMKVTKYDDAPKVNCPFCGTATVGYSDYDISRGIFHEHDDSEQDLH